MWVVGRGAYRVVARKVSMCTGRVLSNPIPKPANSIRQVTTAVTLAKNGVFASDRTTLLREAGRQNAH